MKTLFLSDTHNQLGCVKFLNLPKVDIVFHSGDFTNFGQENEIMYFAHWFKQIEADHHVIIAGNHELGFSKIEIDKLKEMFLEYGIIYLQDDGVQLNGLNIYGTPWQKEFYDWEFNLPAGSPELKEKFDNIPNDTHILLTHTPPYGILDKVGTESVGEPFLLEKLNELDQLKINAFGHIHPGYGIERIDGQWFINASILGNFNLPFQERIVIALLDDELDVISVEQYDPDSKEYYEGF